MKFALSLIGIVCLYILAFQVNVVVSSVMLVAHSIFEYLQYQEMKRQAAQVEFVRNLLLQSGEVEEPHHGNC